MYVYTSNMYAKLKSSICVFFCAMPEKGKTEDVTF